jgi:deazaflavin-dependent oxidoreductase (nitroreductase family)
MAPSPLTRLLLRAPLVLYSAHAGWLLGHRFLCLTHRGRRSGKLHRVVVEAIAWRPDRQEAVVMAGFGRRSQWYQNILAGGACAVQLGRLRFIPEVRTLDAQEAAAAVADYERRNRAAAPLIRAVLSRLAGFAYDGSDAGRLQVVERLPLVAFRPRDQHAEVPERR